MHCSWRVVAVPKRGCRGERLAGRGRDELVGADVGGAAELAGDPVEVGGPVRGRAEAGGDRRGSRELVEIVRAAVGEEGRRRLVGARALRRDARFAAAFRFRSLRGVVGMFGDDHTVAGRVGVRLSQEVQPRAMGDRVDERDLRFVTGEGLGLDADAAEETRPAGRLQRVVAQRRLDGAAHVEQERGRLGPVGHAHAVGDRDRGSPRAGDVFAAEGVHEHAFDGLAGADGEQRGLAGGGHVHLDFPQSGTGAREEEAAVLGDDHRARRPGQSVDRQRVAFVEEIFRRVVGARLDRDVVVGRGFPHRRDDAARRGLGARFPRAFGGGEARRRACHRRPAHQTRLPPSPSIPRSLARTSSRPPSSGLRPSPPYTARAGRFATLAFVVATGARVEFTTGK